MELETRAVAVNEKGLIGIVRYKLSADEDEIILRTIEAGICGTDKDLAMGNLPQLKLPPGQDYLIIGHECKAEVYKAPPDSSFKEGDIVVPMVRRGCGICRLCKLGMPEYCESGEFKELGIIGVNGCFSEFFKDELSALIKVPKGVEDVAVLAEPLSGLEKAMDQILSFQRGRIPWRCDDGSMNCRKVLIIGTGPIAFLFAMLAKSNGFNNIYISNIRELRKDEIILVNTLDLKFYNSKDGYLQLYKEIGPFDLVFDTTGLPSVAAEVLQYMNYNSVLLLYGFPRKDDTGILRPKIMNEIVYKNLGIIGSVTGPKWGFEAALNHLASWKSQYPTVLDIFLKTKISFDEIPDYLKRPKFNEIKVIIDFNK